MPEVALGKFSPRESQSRGGSWFSWELEGNPDPSWSRHLEEAWEPLTHEGFGREPAGPISVSSRSVSVRMIAQDEQGQRAAFPNYEKLLREKIAEANERLEAERAERGRKEAAEEARGDARRAFLESLGEQ